MVPFSKETCGGTWLSLSVVNPDTVCCEESILFCALRTVGVEPHPAFAIQKDVEAEKVTWRFTFAHQSKDGLYDTGNLIKWWNSPEWLRQNPTHEWTVVKNALTNMARQALEIRQVPTYLLYRRGRDEARVPTTASPALREFRIGQLEGRIPFDALPPVESKTAAA